MRVFAERSVAIEKTALFVLTSFFTASKTSGEVMLSMHSRSFFLHSRSKQGAHATAFLITISDAPAGPVCSGDVEPKIATTGVPDRVSDMHGAGIIRKKYIAFRNDRDQLTQGCPAAQIQQRIRAMREESGEPIYFISDPGLFRAAEEDNAPANLLDHPSATSAKRPGCHRLDEP